MSQALWAGGEQVKLISKLKKMPHAFGQTPVVAGLGDPPSLGGVSLPLGEGEGRRE